jgi:hypothetical protein
VWREVLRDPANLRAYLLTKVAVLLLATLATWPLARVLGARAWVGLAVFAALLGLVTLVVLLAARTAPPAEAVAEHGAGDEGSAPGEAVVLPLEDSIDLHSFPPESISGVVEDYLEAALAAGFHSVRLVHGRGIGVQRERVRSLLARHPGVTAFHDAPPELGGWGATVAQLKVEALSRQG